MKISDIMRDIADLIDQKMSQGPGPDSGMSTNSTQKKLTKVEVEPPEDTDQAKMVPPLQAKLEILKKSEGLPNVYDDCEDDAGDELTVIKKNAGLSAAQHEASEDNDVLG
jgi:hypothetical protein